MLLLIHSDTEVTIKAFVDEVFQDNEGFIKPYRNVFQKGLLLARACVDTMKSPIPVTLVNIR